MNLRKIPHFYHITHDLQFVWVIWDMYVDTLHVGQVIRNLDYLPYNKGRPAYESVFYGRDFECVCEGHPDEESALAAIKQHLHHSSPRHPPPPRHLSLPIASPETRRRRSLVAPVAGCAAPTHSYPHHVRSGSSRCGRSSIAAPRSHRSRCNRVALSVVMAQSLAAPSPGR